MWWPCTVVALCADDVPQNVLKKGKAEDKKRRKGLRADAELPPLVLVQFLETVMSAHITPRPASRHAACFPRCSHRCPTHSARALLSLEGLRLG